ncbi:MAG: DUF938 domain-containing protein [Acidobacteria bacterium]|nr:DUF938 domain-containing protein [Acidobacteriota bacterium]
MKPYAPACDRNGPPILDILRQTFCNVQHVLEIGSGTGQHAVFFAPQLPHLIWQPSDRVENLPGIQAWMEENPSPNLAPPIALDVDGSWPETQFDGLFSANTLHIMGMESVIRFWQGLGQVCSAGATVCIYGPFNVGGQYTSESNAAFDIWLKDRDPLSAIRDLETIESLAQENGFFLAANHAMPANNQMLVFHKQEAE